MHNPELSQSHNLFCTLQVQGQDRAVFPTPDAQGLMMYSFALRYSVLGNLPHTINVKRHESNDLLSDGSNTGRVPN